MNADKKRSRFWFYLRLSAFICGLNCFSQQLWYTKPAQIWTDALPVGNGRLGAMVFGGASHERIQFNEQTVWTGEPHDYAHKGAVRSLAKIRELLFAGKQKEAEDLAMQEFMSVPVHQKAYQPFGDLVLDFPGLGDPQDYRRELDLDTGVAATQFTEQGVTYRREVFASWPDKVIVVRLTAARPASLSFETALNSAHEGSAISATPAGSISAATISMTGRVKDGAIRFEARVVVNAEGGKI